LSMRRGQGYDRVCLDATLAGSDEFTSNGASIDPPSSTRSGERAISQESTSNCGDFESSLRSNVALLIRECALLRDNIQSKLVPSVPQHVTTPAASSPGSSAESGGGSDSSRGSSSSSSSNNYSNNRSNSGSSSYSSSSRSSSSSSSSSGSGGKSSSENTVLQLLSKAKALHEEIASLEAGLARALQELPGFSTSRPQKHSTLSSPASPGLSRAGGLGEKRSPPSSASTSPSSPQDQKHTRGSAHRASAEEPMPPPSREEIASILSQMQFPAAQWGGAQGGDLLRLPSPIVAPVAFCRTAKDDVAVAMASSSLSTKGPRPPQPAITTAANDPATRLLDGNWRPLPQPPHSAGQLSAEAELLGAPQVARFAGGSTSLGQPAHEPGHLGSAEEQHMVDIEWQFRQQVAAQQLRQAQQALQVEMHQQQQLQSQLIPPGSAPMPLYPAPQPVHAQGQMHNFWQPSLSRADSAESVRTFFFF
jgi:hypothetical protein